MFIFQSKQETFFTNSDNSTIFIICSYIVHTGGRRQQLLNKNVFSQSKGAGHHKQLLSPYRYLTVVIHQQDAITVGFYVIKFHTICGTFREEPPAIRAQLLRATVFFVCLFVCLFVFLNKR